MKSATNRGWKGPLCFPITSFEGKSPRFDPTVFVDPSARLIGDVVLEPGVSIWPYALLRADSDRIRVGQDTAVLDRALIESPKGFPVLIERRALISHGAILHGCMVREGATVGIGAIVLDGAEIGTGAIVGSGSVVPPGMKVPEKTLVLGIPARVSRSLNEGDGKKAEQERREVYDKSKKYLELFGPRKDSEDGTRTSDTKRNKTTARKASDL